jgi:hypothetical protein
VCVCVCACVCITKCDEFADKLQFDATLDRPLTFLEQMEREKDTTQSSLDTFKAPGTGDVCVCVCVSVYTHAHTLTRTHIRILLRKQATVIYLSVCYYICVRMLLYLCPYATIFVSVCYYICVLKALRRLLRPKAPGSICVRIQRYMCPHTHVYVLILKRESRQSGYYN